MLSKLCPRHLLTFYWNTTNVSMGKHTLKVENHKDTVELLV